MNLFEPPSCLLTNSRFYGAFPYKWILKGIRTDYLKYLKVFESVFKIHSENEFEIQIRGQEISAECQEVLNRLESEFSCLQYHEKITSIVSSYCGDFLINNIFTIWV